MKHLIFLPNLLLTVPPSKEMVAPSTPPVKPNFQESFLGPSPDFGNSSSLPSSVASVYPEP